MDSKLMNYHLGVIYRRANTWWKLDHLEMVMKRYKTVKVTIIDVTDGNFTMPSDLDFLAILPQESDFVVDFIRNNKKLKWIHCLWAGVDKFLNKKEIFDNDNIILTNARGAYAESLAQYAIFVMTYYYFNTSVYLKGFNERKWTVPVNKLLKDKVLLVVGYGLNGIEIAKKAKLGFEMRVIGVRKPQNDNLGAEYVEEIHDVDKLDNLLPKADFVLSVLPHTEETIDLYNFKRFKLMKSSSYFINIGRGSCVVEEDLIRALNEKVIAGAALDVTKTEPLPSTSPLFDVDKDKLFLSFHSCDNTNEYFQQGVTVLEKNLVSYLKEGKLTTVVDKKLGY